MEKLRQQIEQRLSAVTGDACFYYENLATGVCFGHAADKPVVAASVIKLAALIEAFRQMDADAVRSIICMTAFASHSAIFACS